METRAYRKPPFASGATDWFKGLGVQDAARVPASSSGPAAAAASPSMCTASDDSMCTVRQCVQPVRQCVQSVNVYSQSVQRIQRGASDSETTAAEAAADTQQAATGVEDQHADDCDDTQQLQSPPAAVTSQSIAPMAASQPTALAPDTDLKELIAEGEQRSLLTRKL